MTRPYRRWTPDGKACSRCGVTKSASEFSPNSVNPKGERKLRSNCKACNCELMKLPRYKQFEKTYRARAQATPGSKWKQKRTRCQRTYRERYPEKDRAKRILLRSIAAGLVVKPSTCEGCSAQLVRRQIHGHHHKGYSFPLEVQWLCQTCHNAVHQGKETPNEALNRNRTTLVRVIQLWIGARQAEDRTAA